MSRLRKIGKISKKTAKLLRQPELVTQCDNPDCKKDLGRTCVRTDGSAVCASGCGLSIKRYQSGLIKFFCSNHCRSIAS
jgi:hypothetical protein